MGRTFVAVLALSLTPTLAEAQVAFSSLGPGETWSRNSFAIAGPDSGAGPVVVGNRFTSAATGPLSGVDIALSYFSGTPNALEVRLSNATGEGEIGTVIESWTVPNLREHPVGACLRSQA